MNILRRFNSRGEKPIRAISDLKSSGYVVLPSWEEANIGDKIDTAGIIMRVNRIITRKGILWPLSMWKLTMATSI